MTPYEFYVEGIEIQGTISEALNKSKDIVETEKVLDIIYHPQSLFRVRSVTRCTSSIPGNVLFRSSCDIMYFRSHRLCYKCTV